MYEYSGPIMVNLLHQACEFLIFVHTPSNCMYGADRNNLHRENEIVKETRSIFNNLIAILQFLAAIAALYVTMSVGLSVCWSTTSFKVSSTYIDSNA